MTIEMKKVWFDGKKMVTQNIPESDIYKRHWDIASCKAYAQQLRDKNRANTAEHAAEAIEYLLTLTQPKQEPVAHSVIAGVLFDFMGWLTSRKERIVLSSVDEASPAVEAITEFAKMRNLSLDDAKVQDWHTIPPQRTWVGLTHEERYLNDGRTDEEIEYAKAIEAKLKDKNT